MILDSDALRAAGLVLAAMDAHIEHGITFKGEVFSHLGGDAAESAVVKWDSSTEAHVLVIP